MNMDALDRALFGRPVVAGSRGDEDMRWLAEPGDQWSGGYPVPGIAQMHDLARSGCQSRQDA